MKFRKLLDIFFKKDSVLLANIENVMAEKAAIQKEVDKFIESGNHEMYFKVIQNGYIPSKEQVEKIDILFDKAVYPFAENVDVILNLLDHGFTLEPRHVEKIFFNCSFMIYSKDILTGKDEENYRRELTKIYKSTFSEDGDYEEEIEERIQEFFIEKEKNAEPRKNWYGLARRVKSLIKEQEYSDALLKKWIEYIEKETIHFDLLVADPYMIMRDLWKEKLNVNDYEKILTRFNTLENKLNNRLTNNYEKWGNFLTILKQDYAVLAEERDNNLLSRVKSVYVENNVEKKAIAKQQQLTQTFSIKRLDREAQKIILEIEDKCKKLEGSTEIEIQFLVDNTLDKVLPETLRKYFSIDEEYRLTMSNKDGKNAHILLLESLNNINETLGRQLKIKNEVGLKEMEVNAVYTKRLGV